MRGSFTPLHIMLTGHEREKKRKQQSGNKNTSIIILILSSSRYANNVDSLEFLLVSPLDSIQCLYGSDECKFLQVGWFVSFTANQPFSGLNAKLNFKQFSLL